MYPLTLLLLLLTLTLLFPSHTHSQPHIEHDAASLLTFKSKADPFNHLLFTLHHPFDYCHWHGVKCQHSRIVRFSIPNTPLHGTFPPNSLTLLPHLRVLVLSNTSLSGPSLPTSISSLTSALSSSTITPSPPPSLLPSSPSSPSLQSNLFNGELPPFNQSELRFFNVSGNNLSGSVPSTPTLSHFPISSFSLNPLLCGELVNKPCHSPSPFFSSPSSNSTISSNNNNGGGGNDSASLLSPPQSKPHRKHKLMILGFSFAGLLLILSLLLTFLAARKKSTTAKNDDFHSHSSELPTSERETKDKEFARKRRKKSGDLVFCDADYRLYTLEQLMRGSAEMLGRGIMGTTYKAKLDNQLILTVKRIDATKLNGVDGEMFERLMETVGGLRHPNLVPVRAYFQAKEERLIIFDYQANGSVFNLIH
ncbi:hypothetical protein RDABS01_005033, partial [Bienertia sinuspersici]